MTRIEILEHNIATDKQSIEIIQDKLVNAYIELNKLKSTHEVDDLKVLVQKVMSFLSRYFPDKNLSFVICRDGSGTICKFAYTNGPEIHADFGREGLDYKRRRDG